MRSIRLATALSALAAGVVVYALERALQWSLGISLAFFPEAIQIIAVFSAGTAYMLLSEAGKYDPVVALAASAWRRADYSSALFRLRLFTWGNGRVPFRSFLLTSANRPDQAYRIAANATLTDTDIEDPTYHLDFACGRAALAQHNFETARLHFDRLYLRFPWAALSRYALGDLLLWQIADAERSHQLLSSALAISERDSVPHWERLGLEAELYASYAWCLAVIQKADGFQVSFDKAIRLAGDSRPVQAAVHLRLGFALSELGRPTTARQHWQYARKVDPTGWAGTQAALELEARDRIPREIASGDYSPN